LGRRGEDIEMSIVNDGRVPSHVESGNGLTGMRERLQAIGGSLEVGTGDQRFTVLVRLPRRLS
jgi:signal transduction histidine kinase